MKTKAQTGKLLSGRVLDKHREAWDMWIDNYTQQQIADHFGVTRRAVQVWLLQAAGEFDGELPREVVMRGRFEQVDSKISALEERQSQPGLPHALYIAYSAEIRKWYDFRARLRAEYAPQQIQVESSEAIRYQIDMPAETREALS